MSFNGEDYQKEFMDRFSVYPSCCEMGAKSPQANAPLADRAF